MNDYLSQKVTDTLLYYIILNKGGLAEAKNVLILS
jgi:hypothetical protein